MTKTKKRGTINLNRPLNLNGPWSVKFSEAEQDYLIRLRTLSGGLSISVLVRRCISIAAPQVLSGSIPLFTFNSTTPDESLSRRTGGTTKR